MPEKIDPPEGVLQFKRTETVILKDGLFRNGSFEKIEVHAKTIEGWRAATPDERKWFLDNERDFRAAKRAERSNHA